MSTPLLTELISKKDAVEIVLQRFEKWAWIFGVIVVIGVAGEAIFGFGILWNNPKLRSLQKQIDSEQEKITSEKERQASATSDQMKLEIAAANARSAEASLALEKYKAPRSLDPSRLLSLKMLVSRMPRGEIDVWILGNTTEIDGISNLLIAVFRETGWDINVTRPLSGSATGIWLLTRIGSVEALEATANLLVSHLRSVGLSASRYGHFPEVEQGPISIGSGPTTRLEKAALRMIIGAKA